MSDDQFSKLSEQIAAIGERVDGLRTEMDKRFDLQEERFKTMLDERFKEFEEGSFDRLAGHLSTEIEAVKDRLSSVAQEVNKTNDLVDGLYKRRMGDEKKQAELEGEQRRQRRWIHQLADHSGAKLAPEM